MATITRPAPEAGEAQLVTTTIYDNLGRPIEERLADGTSSFREYFPSGELKTTSGSQTYTGSGVES